MTEIKLGDRVNLIGRMRYLQDFAGRESTFDRVMIWTVDWLHPDGNLIGLRARGYGELPGHYGNGIIVLSRHEFDNHALLIEPAS